MRKTAIAFTLTIPALAWAVGSQDSSEHLVTETTTQCTNGMVWADASETCVAPSAGLLSDDVLYRAAREFAHAGQFEHALGALAEMSDPSEDRVLTYLGFAHDENGSGEVGMAYYSQAIAQNPDNLLARSYMGQAYVKLGVLNMANEQLSEIRARGGARTWPEIALERAIETGRNHSY